MAQPLPLILLPPSEGKATGGAGPRWLAGSMAIDLDIQRKAVIRALAAAMSGEETARAKLLDVTGNALAAATAANRAVAKAQTTSAIERYTGVLYDALDHRSLSAAHRRRLDDSVVIFSGLWGLVTAADPIPSYKLKMGATLAPVGKLSTWWREPLSARLSDLAADRHVWNLLPNEHAAAWHPVGDIDQWTVRFLQHRDGKFITVSHDNKSLKGALVRFLLANPTAEPADLARWKHPAGYRLDRTLTEQHGSFTLLSLTKR